MKPRQLAPEKGRILLSEPFLTDSFFKRSAILLAENTENGAMGFILNKPVGYVINELITDFPEFDAQVYFGGPVESNSLFFIHTVPDLLGFSFEIEDGIFYGGDYDKVKKYASLDLLKPSEIRFFAGYSGWDTGQLDFEMEEDSWLVFDRPETLLQMKPESLWGELLKQSRSEMAIWANYTDDPSLN
ncbi:MAG: YqgE/AlgH family protein [Bacteroidia bacterium]